MKVKNGNNVSVHYRGTFNDGTEFDNSRIRGQILKFEIGSGRMITGFNDAVVGMSVGETRSIKLRPEDAYGPRQEDAVRTVPKSSFGEDFEVRIGEMIQGNGPRGPFMAKIEEELDEGIVLDFNHPLAGKEINFDIELLSIDPDAIATSPAAEWNGKMKKAELLGIAKSNGLNVNTKSTKAQIIEALDSL